MEKKPDSRSFIEIRPNYFISISAIKSIEVAGNNIYLEYGHRSTTLSFKGDRETRAFLKRIMACD